MLKYLVISLSPVAQVKQKKRKKQTERIEAVDDEIESSDCNPNIKSEERETSTKKCQDKS